MLEYIVICTVFGAAAALVAHSKARNAGLTGVHCTRARDVKKPRGVKTGTVTVSRGDTLRVRPDVSAAHGLAPEARTGFELIARHPTAARGGEFALELRARWRDGGCSEILCSRTLSALGTVSTRSDEEGTARLAVLLPSGAGAWSMPKT